LSSGQYGGESSFMFLDITNSAKEEALGSNNISLTEDLHFAMSNPALIDSAMHNSFGGTWGSMFIMQTGVGIGNIAYCRNIKGNPYTVGVKYISYGAFESYDEQANQQPSVMASDLAVTIGTSRPVTSKISWGAQIKPIASYLADYSSYAIALDAGAIYNDTARLLTVAVLMKNAGYQMKPYTTGNQQNMPFDAQIGVTKKLRHAPLRVSATYRYLHKWDLSYENTLSKSSGLGNAEEKNDWWMDAGSNLLKHFVFGAEVFIGKHLYAAAAYNIKQYSELKLENKSGGAGLSLGFGITTQKFSICYGRNKYSIAGGTNFISLTTNFDKILATKRTKNTHEEN